MTEEESLLFAELVMEYEDCHRAIIDCDPSVSPDAMDTFYENEQWLADLHKRCKKLGVDWEVVEAEAGT